MSWWMWVLLWTVLVLVSTGFLVWLGWRVARLFFRFLREAEEVSADLSQRWDRAAEGAATRLREAPVPAVFTPVAEARVQYDRDKEQLRSDRSVRRMHRRQRRHQPQLISDLRRAERKGISHG